jgi:F420-dependent oxidoreductase-like protein
LRRDKPVEFDGEYYTIPAPEGPGTTGLGKPLKTIVHPLRPDLPIYLAAIGPRNVALAGEIADGWLPTFFSPSRMAMYREWLDEGLARSGRSAEGFDIAPMVPVFVGDDVQQCRDLVKPFLALYVGGMGARGQNFYNSLAQRYGYEEAAAAIQDLYLDGRKGEAAAAVPDELVDEVSLVGPPERIAERMAIWRDAGVTTLIATTLQLDALRALAAENG